MGTCCCCLSSAETSTRRRQHQRGRQESQSYRERTTTTSYPWQDGTSSRPGADGMCVCSVCGMHVDPALIDGHREACRSHYARTPGGTSAADTAPSKAAQALKDHQDTSDLEGHDEDEICVVCLERLRCFAFLPCGHIATCGSCAKQLDTCPLCRQQRQGLCYVPADTLSQYQCKHCHQFIAPTLYDGHREVCGLRMRMAQKEQEEKLAEEQQKVDEAASKENVDSNSAPLLITGPPTSSSQHPHEDLPTPALAATDTTPGAASTCGAGVSSLATSPATSPNLGPKKAKHLLSLCVECGREDPQLVICIPCGHRVMCGSCASQRATCPVCLLEFKHSITTYE